MSWCSVVLFVCKTVSARPSWHTFPDIHPFWGWVSILLKNSELFYLTHHDITFISFMSPGSVESAPLIFVWSHLCRTIQGGLNERCAIHLFQYLNTTSVKGGVLLEILPHSFGRQASRRSMAWSLNPLFHAGLRGSPLLHWLVMIHFSRIFLALEDHNLLHLNMTFCSSLNFIYV